MRGRLNPLVLVAIFALAAFSLSNADQGDDLLKKLTIPPAPALAPADALKSFKLAPGFKMEVAACEPLVQDPIAACFDGDGRLWVCEMTGYMPDVAATNEKAPIGRIVCLEDTDGDGKFDKRTVFLDGLVLPRALGLAGDGVLVGENAKLWYCRDKDGDGKCDERTYVCEFGGLGDPEYSPNGLAPALDNWIYCANWSTRLRRTETGWAREATTPRGQWGITQDDLGRLFYNSNSSLLRGDLAPCYSPAVHQASSLTNAGVHDSGDVYPIRINPGVNRYYHLRPDGKLKAVTAACGPVVYRGDNLPADVRGNAFICEPAGNLVRRNVFYENKGKLTSKNAYDQAEFLASSDERFRPVNLANGPDGALYVVDFYRGVIQHKVHLTPFLKNQALARGLEKPTAMGRIYRIVHDTSTPRKAPHMSKQKSVDLVAHLSHANGWWRDTAQRLLVDRNDAAVVPDLENLIGSGANPLGRQHALWTLEGMNKLDGEVVASALADKDAAVRASAAALCRRFLKAPPDPNLVRELSRLGKDDSADVRLQLVFTLGLVASPQADQALEPMFKSAAQNPAVLDAVLAGFGGKEAEFLSAHLDQPAWAKPEPWRDKLLSLTANRLWRQRQPLAILRFLHLVAAQPDSAAWRQSALLQGMTAPPAKNDKAKPRPVKLPIPSEDLAKLRQAADAKVRAAAETLAAELIWPGKDGKPLPKPPPLSSRHQALHELGQKEYLGLCATCHQPAGYGEAGKAPPLLDSDWLEGSEERLVRIVLHGLRGPITLNQEIFNGDGSLEMPAMAMNLDDQKIAGILTYVRREWGEFAPPVEPETVARLRTVYAGRHDQWTETELAKGK